MTSRTYILEKRIALVLPNNLILQRLLNKKGLLSRGTNRGIWEKAKMVHLVLLYDLSSHTKISGKIRNLFSINNQYLRYLTSALTLTLEHTSHCKADSLVSQMVKSLPAVRETWVRSLGQEDPLKKEMATHSSTIAWKIPWAEEPGRLQSMGQQRVGHDCATNDTFCAIYCSFHILTHIIQ